MREKEPKRVGIELLDQQLSVPWEEYVKIKPESLATKLLEGLPTEIDKEPISKNGSKDPQQTS